MRTRIHCISAAIRTKGIRADRRTAIGINIAAFVIAVLALPCGLFAQNVAMESAAAPGADPGAPPVAESGGVNFFSQDLGSMLRLRYNTESYGQDGQGNFDIGSMQVITLEDTAAILDGQVTMNEADGVGFNVGVGYRWMNFPFYSASTGRVDGVAVWADGTHTAAGNFFPQIGVSYESLGESWDVRSNMYIPVGPQDKIGNFTPTGEIGFQGNSIAQLTQAVKDSSFTVGEIEVARRLGVGRDAWAFAGPYFLTNDDDDAAGYRVGLRGYAFPDLLVQVAVSDDEIFDTYASFQVQWFVGRTRNNFQNTCGVPDRMREPFMRNDYVALRKSTATGGNALTDANGDPLRIVHFDSTAAAGGDGTFENPYNELNEGADTGSQEGDILFAHSTSTFDTGLTLKNNQRLLGEGDGFEHTVATLEEGTIPIPESSLGARALDRPTVNVATNSDAIALADNNEVSNFDMNGQNLAGTTAIAGLSANKAGNANLNNLAISNVTDDAIVFAPSRNVDTDDLDNDDNITEALIRGDLTVDNVTFTNVGGFGVSYEGAPDTDVALANTTLSETIAISNVTFTGGTGVGIDIENTHSGRTATLSNYTYDGSTTSAGAIRLNDIDGTFTASNSMLKNGATTGSGVQILGDSDGTITFESTVAFDSLDGIALDINGTDGVLDSLGGSISVLSDITNDTGRSVSIRNITTGASVTLNGDITDSGQGILIDGNSGGAILFAGDLNMDTTTFDAITLNDNATTTIDFPGKVDITTTTGDGLIATLGGTLTISGATNSISTNTGQIAKITGMTIGTPGNVRFADIRRDASAATNAIQLENNTGGSIDFGLSTDNAGDAGTIVGGTADAILIRNSSNVSVNGVRINNGANAVSGVVVDKTNTTPMTVTLGGLETNGGTTGVAVTGNGTTGNLDMIIEQTAINGPTGFGLSFDNVDAGTITVRTNTTIDGNNANAGSVGVRILNSNATFTFDNTTAIREWGTTDFDVNGGTGTISFAGSIVNNSTVNSGDTSGQSVRVHNVTGGSVAFTSASTINDNNAGILVDNNGTASISFLGTHTLNTTSDAVSLTNNDVGGTNANISFSRLNITTTGTGRGFVASGGGTLSATGTNQINSDNGTGLSLTDMTISGTGVDFNTVTVDGGTGPANAIVLQNLTGGQVTIGPASGAVGAGGQLRSTDDAIVIQNVQNADLRQIQILSAGDAAGEHAMEISHTAGATTAMDITIDGLRVDAAFDAAANIAAANANSFTVRLTDGILNSNVAMALTGAGDFGLLVDNTDVTATGTDTAFSIAQSGSAKDAVIVIRNGSRFEADNATALAIDSSGGSGKTVQMLIEDSAFQNDSTLDTVNIIAQQTSLMEATIQGNTFTNSNGAGVNFDMTSSGASAFVRLNLGGDGADRNVASAGTGEYQLHELGGSDFDLFEQADTVGDLRNTGTVVTDPNDAAFDDLPVAPTPPSAP